jgi:hypothetical protein
MPGCSHFNLFNRDTRDLFILCIVLMCRLYRVVFYYCCSISLLLFVYFVRCSTFPFICCSTFVSFDSFAFHCSLLRCSKRKDSILILDCIPDISILLYPLYKNYHHHLCKSINIIHQTALTLS